MYTSKQHFGQIQFIHLVTSFHWQAHYVNVKHTLTKVLEQVRLNSHPEPIINKVSQDK